MRKPIEPIVRSQVLNCPRRLEILGSRRMQAKIRVAGSAAGRIPLDGPSQNGVAPMANKTPKTHAEWRAKPTAEQYSVTRQKSTEPALSREYPVPGTPGIYHSVCCGPPLFRSAA